MNKDRLVSGLEMMGVAFDQTAIERFEAFHAILDEYNQKMDLTAVLDEDERTAVPPVVADNKTQPKTAEDKTKSESTAKNPFAALGGDEGKDKKDGKDFKRMIPETYTVEEGDLIYNIDSK